MKVKKLIELLKTYPENFQVILAKDGEGNGFSPLSDDSEGIYEAECTWSGHLLHPDDAGGKKSNSVVLWPVN